MRIRGFAPSTPCWVELTTSHPDDAAGFYAGLFGWQVEGDRFVLGGRAVAGIRRAQPGESQGWLTYLAAPELEETTQAVTRAYGRQITRVEERQGARTAIVSDSSGAVFGLWQAAGFGGAQLRGEPGTMEWSDLLTSDISAATAFYGGVFGWTLTDEFGSREWLSEAHDSVAGLIAGRYDVRWQPSFQVAETTETIDRCAGLGGRVVAGPVEMGLGSYVEMVDPQGSPFAVTSPVERKVELNVAYNDIIGMELTYGG